jgi:hypothetical protein
VQESGADVRRRRADLHHRRSLPALRITDASPARTPAVLSAPLLNGNPHNGARRSQGRVDPRWSSTDSCR